MHYGGSYEEQRIALRRQQARKQRAGSELLVSSPTPSSPTASFSSPTLSAALIRPSFFVSREGPPSASAIQRTTLRHATSAVVADVFCRESVSLTILQGFAEAGELFSLPPQAERRGHLTSSRSYERLSLHLQLGHAADEDGLRCFLPSTSRVDLPLLLFLPMEHIVHVSRGTAEDSDDNKHLDELWLGAKVRARQGELHTEVSLCVRTGNIPVSEKLYTLLTAAWEQRRRQRQAAVAETATSSRGLARDALKSLRSLQQQTGRLLSDLRSEFVDHPTVDVDLGERFNDSHDAWVERTVVRRHALGEAQATLDAIQVRRKMRASRMSALVDGRTGLDSHDTENHRAAAASSPTSALASDVTPLSKNSFTVPRIGISLHNSAPAVGDRYMCKHCGENLHNRQEQRDHQHVCAYRMVRCRKCGEQVRAKRFAKHRSSNECRGKPRNSHSHRKSSNVSEVSSSSMEELESDTVSNSASSISRPRRHVPSHLKELPRADSGRWEDIRPSSSMRRSSSRLSMEALQRHNSQSPPRSTSDISSPRQAGSMRRTGSTLEDVQTRCTHCGRRAPSTHPARCAYRPVQCAVCGVEVMARDAPAHAALHRR